MRPADDGSFGIYVHWPFCAQKCPYCDFNSHVRHKGWDEARFLSAYKRELDYVAALIEAGEPQFPSPLRGGARGGGNPNDNCSAIPPSLALPREGGGNGRARGVTSIFFGGGTPSLMKAETVGAILDHIAGLWTIAPDAEITLEANPGSVEASRFKGYRAAGVNRVSLGVQSLRDTELKKLGRIHTAAEAKAALGIAATTFDRFSLDLIYARPGQTPAEWRAELGDALALAGRHISLYQLTIEPDTPYATLHSVGKLTVPDGEAAHDLYEVTQELTEAAGLPAYEISNHAAPGEESRHNMLYWRYGAYAGVGPGAHGRLIIAGTRHAMVTERNPERWADRVERDGHGFTEIVALTRSEEADEMLLMGLRLSEGVDLDRLADIGGARVSPGVLSMLAAQGLIEAADGAERVPDEIRACVGPGVVPELEPVHSSRRIRATRRGRFVLNTVVAKIAAGLEPVSP